MSRKAGNHPHYAGHRSGGHHVGAGAKRSGPAPGQTEFSADQEKAMRAGSPAGAFPQDGGGAPSMGGAAPSMGAPPAVGGSPVPPDLDSDGGI